MAAKIKNQKWFRWHDAGDVQSSEHMQKILEVCRLTPETRHWLPTQERQFLPAPEEVPANLVIRLSRSKIDGPAPAPGAMSQASLLVKLEHVQPLIKAVSAAAVDNAGILK